jgi:hypothetical protein
MTVAVPATMPSTSYAVEWKWWKGKTPSTQARSQPLRANSLVHASAACVSDVVVEEHRQPEFGKPQASSNL